MNYFYKPADLYCTFRPMDNNTIRFAYFKEGDYQYDTNYQIAQLSSFIPEIHHYFIQCMNDSNYISIRIVCEENMHRLEQECFNHYKASNFKEMYQPHSDYKIYSRIKDILDGGENSRIIVETYNVITSNVAYMDFDEKNIYINCNVDSLWYDTRDKWELATLLILNYIEHHGINNIHICIKDYNMYKRFTENKVPTARPTILSLKRSLKLTELEKQGYTLNMSLVKPVSKRTEYKLHTTERLVHVMMRY